MTRVQTDPFPPMPFTSQFLRTVMLKLRAGRSKEQPETHYVRYDSIGRGRFAQVWFATRGCSWDRRGTCTMCNYGTGPDIDDDTMVGYVHEALSSIDYGTGALAELYVSPSGSLLDRVEVPDGALRRIIDLVAEVPVPRFGFETRPETIDPVTLEMIRNRLPDKDVNIGIGLETINPMTAACLVNKTMVAERVVETIDVLHDHGIELYANVCVGWPPLTPMESVRDALTAVRWALDLGIDQVIVFPLHAKRATIPGFLHERGLHTPPSLWQLVDLVTALPPDRLDRVTITWYRDDYGTNSPVIASPSTCATCIDSVLDALDDFRADPGRRTVTAMAELDCSCRTRSDRADLGEPMYAEDHLTDRILTMYGNLVDGLGLGPWWESRAEEIISEVEMAVALSPPGSTRYAPVHRKASHD